MTKTVSLSHNSPEVLAAFNRLLAASDDLTDPMIEMASILEAATKRGFETQTDPATGAAWKPLSAVTKQRRKKGAHNRGEQILNDTGRLLRSIESFSGEDFAGIGTNDPRARTHHFGALMGAFGRYYQLSRRQYGENDFRRYAGMRQGHPIPWGNIPARPIFGISAQDEADILDVLEGFVSAALAKNG